MSRTTRLLLWIAFFSSALLASAPSAALQAPEPKEQQATRTPPSAAAAEYRSTYVLGPDDQIAVRVLEAEEIGREPIRIDLGGCIRLPYVGQIHAAGLTVEQLQATLIEKLKPYIHEPDATVNVIEFRSQPVSVLGSVKTPGVHQLQGRKTLVEMLSLAGGLDQNAGSDVRITRRLEWGRIPLRSAWEDPTGRFSVARVSVKSIVDARSPEENIEIRPHDVISVPRAEMVYVMGQVMRSGGFVLTESENMSVLQAVTLAGGLDRFAAPQHSRILRRSSAGQDRTEIAVDLQKILQNRAEDVRLQPEDILLVPNNTPKRALIRAVEAAIQAGTGVVIWRR